MTCRTSIWLLLRFLLLLISAPFVAGAPSPDYGRVEILRDQWGVPNIFSSTDEGAMYGLGYATAEDRLYQMNFNLRLMQGRLAEVVGKLPKRVTRSVPPNNALEEDRLMRAIGFYRHAQLVASNLDGETKKLLQAYADGINDYVAEHSDNLHPLFAEQGWSPEKWTAADSIVSWWQFARFFAGDGLRDLFTMRQERQGRVGGKPVIDDDAAVVRREDVSDEWVEKLNSFAREHGLVGPGTGEQDGPKFSHAWVVGGTKSTTGSAMLISDPQTPVWNPSLLYEFHIAGKTFNARGVGVAGSPVILIGYNTNVAWGMTALGGDQADLFLLETDPTNPNRYKVDGEWVEMKTWTERIKNRGDAEETITLRETLFGPVVSEHALARQRGEEVALRRIPLAENERETIQAGFAMLRARSSQEFLSSLSNWRFPTANCVFGDRAGDIGYSTIGALPIRGRISKGPNQIQDGTSRTNDWRTFIPAELLPQVINPKSRYIVSANHRAIQSFYPLSMGDSTGSMGDTDRGWRIKQRLEGFLSSHEKFSPEDFRAIQSDSVNAVKKEIVRVGYHLRDVQKVELDADALKALRYLEPWFKKGAASDMSIAGTELVNLIPAIFRQNPLTPIYGGGNSGLVFALKTFQKRLNSDAQAKFSSEEINFIESTLSGAWKVAIDRYGSNPDLWLDRAVTVGPQRMGYMESLSGYPSLDAKWDIQRPHLKVYDGSTILAQPGQSYTQFVPMHDADLAEAILPIGISERPDSPFRFSNYGDWAGGKLHPAPLSRAAVDKITVTSKILSAVESPARRPPAARSGRTERR